MRSVLYLFSKLAITSEHCCFFNYTNQNTNTIGFRQTTAIIFTDFPLRTRRHVAPQHGDHTVTIDYFGVTSHYVYCIGKLYNLNLNFAVEFLGYLLRDDLML